MPIDIHFRGLVLVALLFLSIGLIDAQTDREIRNRFLSKEFSVSWEKRREFPKDAELRIGYGSGHGGTLAWVWFRPSETKVDLLFVELDEGWNPYKSKWQPDIVPISVKRGTLEPGKYAALLRQLSIVDSARLSRLPRNSASRTSANFWVAGEVLTNGTKAMSLDWAGYSGTFDETEYTKPRIAVELAKSTFSKIGLHEHVLDREERKIVSSRFVEDWNKYKGREFYWWLRERAIMISGELGDEASLPKLIEIVGGNVTGDASDRLIYFAINAITRITGIDVRPKPVEEMDLRVARERVLELVQSMK